MAGVSVETPQDFDAFVAARAQTLWRSAWLLTGDRQRAEDLVQTALGKAWPHFGKVDSFEAYVRRVLYTTYVAWWRRRWNGEVPTADAGSTLGSLDPEPEAYRDLMTALATLPRGQRAVIVLRFFEDLTEKQASEVLGVSIGTVKSQTARALASLRTSPALAEEES